MLKKKVIRANQAQSDVQEFVEYLKAEHKVEDGYQLNQDLTGFVKESKK